MIALLWGGLLPKIVDVSAHILPGNVQREGKLAFHQTLRLLQNGFIAAGKALALFRQFAAPLMDGITSMLSALALMITPLRFSSRPEVN